MRTTREGARASAWAAALDGFAQGVFLFGLLLLAETLAMGRDEWKVLGAPVPAVASVYLVAGGALGAAVTLAAGVLARAFRLRPARLSLVVVGYACVALFVLRGTPSQLLFAFSPRLVGVMIGAIAAVVVAVAWALRESRARPAPARPLRVLGVGAAGAACAVSLLWVPVRHHRLPARDGAPAAAPNILFVLVDALRADRLSSFGYPRPTSPYIDQLASGGTAFVNAYAHGNRTIISMPTLFTSIYPSYTRAIVGGNWSTPLPDSQTTIAEMCRDAGYTTFAMMSNPFLKRPFGLTQGFDRVEEFDDGRFRLSLYRVLVAVGATRRPSAERSSASAAEVTDAAVAWLRRAPSQSPFFCYVHYMDVHHPYIPPHAYEEMFRSSDWLSSIDPAVLFAKTVQLVSERKPYPLGEEELTRLSDLYDACIRYVDAEIARLAGAATNANGRPTIVVVTSDHGDEFQEHGSLYHNNVVIQELIRVPLVIWRSDRPGDGRRVEELVRHVDVLPTLADWVGATPPASAVGRSLAPFFNGAGGGGPRASVAEGDYCSAVVEPGWKLMRVDTTGTESLFDLDADPWAKVDVSSRHLERATRMQESLDAYLQAAPQGPASPAGTDAATLRQLRALGYMN